MKNLISCLQCIVLFLVISVSLFFNFTKISFAQAANNLLTNSSFDLVLAKNIPSKWFLTKAILGNAEFKVTNDTLLDKSGNILMVKINRRPLQGFHTISQSNIALKPATTYNLSFYAKTISQEGVIGVRFTDSVSKKFYTSATLEATITEGWEKKTLEFTTAEIGAQEGQGVISLQFKGNAGTTFFIDDVVLYEKASENSQPQLIRPAIKKPVVETPAIDKFIGNSRCDFIISGATGNDLNEGSTSKPFKTIKKGISVLKTSNKSTLCIEPGTYNESVLVEGIRGSISNKIKIARVGQGDVLINGNIHKIPVLDCISAKGAALTTCIKVPLFGVINSSNLEISGIQIKESSGAGLRVENSSDIVFSDMDLNNNYGTGLLITNNTSNIAFNNVMVWNNYYASTQVSVPQTSSGVFINSLAQDSIVSNIRMSNMRIFNNYGEGVYVGSFAKNIILEKSQVWDNLRANIYLINTKDTIISSNLVYCSDFRPSWVKNIDKLQTGYGIGVALRSQSSPEAPNSTNNLLLRNIVAGCRINLGLSSNKGTFERNIIANNTLAESRITTDESADSVNGSLVISLDETESQRKNLIVNNIISQKNSVNAVLINDIALKNLILNKNTALGTINAANLNSEQLRQSDPKLPYTFIKLEPSKVTSSLFIPPPDSVVKDYSAPLSSINISLEKDYNGFSTDVLPDAGALEIGSKDSSTSTTTLGTSSYKPAVLGLDDIKPLVPGVISAEECSKFVSSSFGNDTFTGLSLETAFKTIQKGINSISAGEVLCIQGGEYPEKVSLSINGSSSSITRIGAYEGGGDVIIKGGEFSLPDPTCVLKDRTVGKKKTASATSTSLCVYTSLLTITKSRYIDILGLEVTGSSGRGVYVSDSENIRFDSINSHYNWDSGFVIDGTCGNDMTSNDNCALKHVRNIKVENSQFWDNFHARLKKPSTLSKSGGLYIFGRGVSNINISNNRIFENFGEGLVLGNEARNVRVIDNIIWNNSRSSIHINTSIDSYVDKNFVFCSDSRPSWHQKLMKEKTLSYGVGISIKEDAIAKDIVKPSGYNNYLTNNIVVGCSQNMLVESTKLRPIKDTYIINNTLVEARLAPKAPKNSSNLAIRGDLFTNILAANNIIYQSNSQVPSVTGTNLFSKQFKFSNNMVYTNLPTVSEGLPGFIVKDPMLSTTFAGISPDTALATDYSLQEDSPAIDSADSSYQITTLNSDFLSQDRIKADIGALEYGDIPLPDPINDTEDPEDVSDPVDDPSSDIDEWDTQDDVTDFFENEETEDNSYSNNDEDFLEDFMIDFGNTDTEDYVSDMPTSDGISNGLFGMTNDTNSEQLIKNGNFDLGDYSNGMPKGWYLKTGVGGTVLMGREKNLSLANNGDALSLKVRKTPKKGLIELYQSNIPAGNYTLTFSAKSNLGSDLEVYFKEAAFPYNRITPISYRIDLKPTWKEYTGDIRLPFSVTNVSSMRLVFAFKAANEDTFAIDNISLTPSSVANDVMDITTDTDDFSSDMAPEDTTTDDSSVLDYF